jgi:hypothetical protein
MSHINTWLPPAAASVFPSGLKAIALIQLVAPVSGGRARTG